MSGYDNPIRERIDLALHDFGGAAGVYTRPIRGPKGKQGIIRNVGVDVTTATVFATTLGKVEVGTAAAPADYAQLNIPTGVAAGSTVDVADDTNAISGAAQAGAIPADTQVLVTLTEGTGAGLAGAGFPFVEIDWF